MDDARSLPPGPVRPADRIDGLAALVGSLASRVDELAELAGDRRSSDDAGSAVAVKQNLSGVNKTQHQTFADWVDWMQDRYATAGWLRPCWWRHGFVVEELAALYTAWLGVYESDKATEPSAALDWHEAAEKCRERIRQAVSTGPSCTVVRHKPDQSMTDDPRWAEERVAMSNNESETTTPSGLVKRYLRPNDEAG